MKIDEQKIEEILNSVKHTSTPIFNFARVRDQIMDRISIPDLQPSKSWMGRFSVVLPLIRIGAGVMATLLIVISLTLGAYTAALNSVPGQAIYPLKKIAEGVELKLTPTDQRATLQIKFADARADELTQVIQQTQDGQISQSKAQQIVSATVQDLQKSTAAAVKSTSKQNKPVVTNKLADISNKLRAASIASEGTIKIEIDQALAETQQQAVQNLQNAGLKVEDQPIKIDDSITASGKLTAVDETSVSIGTAKFLLTKDTKFVNMAAIDLKTGVVVDIIGQIKDNKSYAVQISLVKETKVETQSIDTQASSDSSDTQ